MKPNLPGIIQRRQQLIAQAAEQRLLLVQQFEPCRRPLLLADHLLSIAGLFRRHPVWLLVGTITLVVWPQSRFGGWLRRGWVIGRVGYQILASRHTPLPRNSA